MNRFGDVQARHAFASRRLAVMALVDVSALEGLLEGHGSLEAALAAWSRSYREVFASHPTLIPLIATLPIAGAPTTRRMYDAVAAALRHGGVPTPQVVPVIIAFESFLFGSALDVHAPASIFTSRPEEVDAPHLQAAVDAFTATVPAGDDAEGTPEAAPEAAQEAASEAASERRGVPVVAAPERNPFADPPFELGLRALIDVTLRLVP